MKKPKRLSRTQFPSAYFRYADYWTPRVCGDYVFAVDTINGMFVVDVSDKSSPKIVGNIVLPKVAPDDASLYFDFPEILNPDTPYGDPLTSVAVGDGVVKFYDIINPQAPRIVLDEKVGHILYNDFGSRKLVSGKYWNLNCHSRGCWIFEVSKNSVRLVAKEYASVNSQTGGTCAFDSRFLMSLKGGYGFLDPEKPLSIAEAQPKMFGNIDEIEAEDLGGKSAMKA